jgi:hypothetical protein
MLWKHTSGALAFAYVLMAEDGGHLVMHTLLHFVVRNQFHVHLRSLHIHSSFVNLVFCASMLLPSFKK